EEQGRAFAAVLDKAGTSALVKNFVGLVIRNRRLFALSDMIRSYNAILAEKRGEMTTDVTSAHPLGDQQVESLKAALKSATGRDVRINTKVDAGLLGGLIVKVGSRMIDSSLRTKLNSLKIAMKEASWWTFRLRKSPPSSSSRSRILARKRRFPRSARCFPSVTVSPASTASTMSKPVKWSSSRAVSAA